MRAFIVMIKDECAYSPVGNKMTMRIHLSERRMNMHIHSKGGDDY